MTTTLTKNEQLAVLSAISMGLNLHMSMETIFSRLANTDAFKRKQLWKRCEAKVVDRESFIPELNAVFSDEVMVILSMADTSEFTGNGFAVARDYLMTVLSSDHK